MCLIAIAHRASESFPLILAANRDEDYDRASHDAHWWPDFPEVAGGRDGVHGGTWLAVRTGGRFAAVTNLRGAERRGRSRGFLVRDFVTGDASVEDYARSIADDATQYAGFHLLAGEVGGELLYISPESHHALAPGIHAFSNAPEGEEWPKMVAAREEMSRALSHDALDALIDSWMRFLQTPGGTGAIESEAFIAGDRYGTRASAVIVATRTEIVFTEQTFARGGRPLGERRVLVLAREPTTPEASA